mmetsp:Transcript_62182/g.166858  ORF Transcript_62182/g.166858 Transcript_62182/m.166858 type:complete len:666 (+) Transcript_62182:10-2007(+)
MLRATRSAAPRLMGCRALATASHPQDYMQQTKIPTYHFQDSLPRLPIPPFDKTIERFLYASTPLVSAADLEETKKLADEFSKGVGPKLYQTIVDRDKANYTSFISKPWFDMYLETRSPLILNINPQLTFIPDPNPKKMEWASRAATLIWSTARFYRTLTDEQLEPDLFHTKACMGGSGEGFFKFLNGRGGDDSFKLVCSSIPKKYAFYGAYLYGSYPLDMSQYSGLFQSTRIPHVGKDELKKYPNSRHIVIQRGAEFYKLDVLRPDGSVVPGAEILSEVKAILSKPPPSKDQPHLGLLTTLDRDAWARAREALVAVPANKAALEEIDSAIFVVCLEDEKTHNMLTGQRLMLHGDAKNRWFDKSFQLIVASDGKAGINFEHSWGDGVAVLRYFNDTCQDAIKSALLSEAPAKSKATPVRFSNPLPPAVESAVKEAGIAADKLINSYDSDVLEVPGFCAGYLKKKDVGLDGSLQMVFQLAHYKMYGHTASTYESANQSAYKHGRTETIRSATPESDAMCRAFVNKSASIAEKEKAFRVAVKNHARITKEALVGAGWDRIFFALKHEAKTQGLPVPGVFNSPGYKTLSEVILSTSTLASPNIDGGGFGPVGPRCYGIGYTTGKLRGELDASLRGVDGFACGVSSYKRNTRGFIDAIDSALKDVRTVLG